MSQAEIYARYHAKNKNKRNRKSSNSVLKKKYGISLEDYYVMLETQQGVCKICGAKQAQESNPQRRFAVDHCHNTGKIRGLLCISCNTGIGMFKDDPELVTSALSYLKEYL